MVIRAVLRGWRVFALKKTPVDVLEVVGGEVFAIVRGELTAGGLVANAPIPRLFFAID